MCFQALSKSAATRMHWLGAVCGEPAGVLREIETPESRHSNIPSQALPILARAIWTGAHILAFMLSNSSSAQPASQNSILPPELPWSGKSKSLLIPATDSWATPFEQSGLNQTPRYEETVAWLQKLVDAAPELKRVSIGTTLEGRDMVMILASSGRRFSSPRFHCLGKGNGPHPSLYPCR
jgi:hypothetical protein